MAHERMMKGTHSQLVAAAALYADGWVVSEPYSEEPYDLVAKDPKDGSWKQIQVKTARIRQERGGAIVVPGTKGDGSPYSKDEADLIIGVLGKDVYIFECRELKEYWAQPATICKWRKLTIHM